MISFFNYRILLTSLFIMLFAGCEKQEEPDNMTDSVTEQLPDQESWNSEIILTSGGKKFALVNTGHFTKFKNKNILFLDEGLEVDFYNKDEIHTSHLSSESGEVDERLNNLTAIGNVVVVSDSGETLFTEKLTWNNKLQKIISDVDVMIATETDTLYGVGFESDAALTSWTIKEPKGKTTRLISEDE